MHSQRALLDTSCLVILDRVTGLPAEWRLSAASLGYGELEWGLQRATGVKLARRHRHIALVKSALGEGLPFDDTCVSAYGLVCHLTEQAGRRPRGRAIDLLIAAVALRHNAVLLTVNTIDVEHLSDHVKIGRIASTGEFRGFSD